MLRGKPVIYLLELKIAGSELNFFVFVAQESEGMLEPDRREGEKGRNTKNDAWVDHLATPIRCGGEHLAPLETRRSGGHLAPPNTADSHTTQKNTNDRPGGITWPPPPWALRKHLAPPKRGAPGVT